MYKILLVEDDEALRYLYKQMPIWHNNGYIISAEAKNGKEALDLLNSSNFDLIISDIRMPIVDGIELLKALQQQHLDTPVVFLSSYSEFEYAQQSLVLGAFDYIIKPPTEEKIKNLLERTNELFLKKQSYLDDYIEKAISNLDIDLINNHFIRKICLFISMNIGNNITMNTIAEYMDLNKDYLGKIFKQKTKISFHHFLTHIKIEYSKTLISNGYKIYEICDKLNYSSPDYFSKIFKETTGITPSQYKKKING